jgi:hypothetical protein
MWKLPGFEEKKKHPPQDSIKISSCCDVSSSTTAL